MIEVTDEGLGKERNRKVQSEPGVVRLLSNGRFCPAKAREKLNIIRY